MSDRLQRLIHEIHRRSLWQVLGIFVAASWVVLQVVEVLTDAAGLPDWTPTMALVLLLIGLPVCLATAIVQEGMPDRGASSQREDRPTRAAPAPDAGVNLAAGTGSLDLPSTRPPRSKRLFTWRNAILGGLAAFTLLGLSVGAYLAMWSAGIGPVGNLVAQGVITAGDRVVLADFEDTSGEGLGGVVTEALRVDLSQAAILDLVDPADIGPTLERMQLEPGTPLGADLAMEVAIRDGIGAVIDGSVAPVGPGYLVTASLREAQSGRALASFRVTADDPSQLIRSIDKLSQDLREKSGESLRGIRAGEPLERVTTASLEALRLYAEADRLLGFENRRSIELLERALEIDPEFAMAWRKLAVAFVNTGRVRRQDEAASKAYEHRDRLTPRERYLAEAFYHAVVEDDPRGAIQAYESVLRIEPDEAAALNNLGNLYRNGGQPARANELYRRAITGPGRSWTAYRNLLVSELFVGRIEGAASVLAEWEAVYPDANAIPQSRYLVALLAGATDRAEAMARARFDDATLGAGARSDAASWLAKVEYRRGRLGEARSWNEQSGSRAARPGATRVALGRSARMAALLDDAGLAREAARDFVRVVTAGGNFAFFEFDLLARGWAEIAFAAAMVGDTELVAEMRQRWLEETSESRDEGITRRLDLAGTIGRAVAGDAEGVVSELERFVQEDECATEYCWRLARATVYSRAGDPSGAIPFYESLASSGSIPLGQSGEEDLHAMLRLGPVYEQAGDTASAVAAYQRIVRMWAEADAEGQEVVRRFQARIDALQGG